MFNVRRIGIALVIFAGAVWVALSFGPANPNRTPGPAESETGRSVLRGHDAGALAARYHLRGRTQRFFRRSSTQIKGRYRTGGKRYPPPRKSSPRTGRARA